MYGLMMAQKPNEYHLVTFDPGGTIGWAHFVVNFKAFSRPEAKVLRYLESWDCGEFTGQEDAQLSSALALVRSARYGSAPFTCQTDVVSEDFELTQLIGGKDLLSPVRINAVLDWECKRRFALSVQMQARQMRTSVTPARLRLFGFEGKWTTSGKGKDAFSAMQHGVVWLRRIKQKSLSLPWKLEDGIATNARWDCKCERNRLGKTTSNRVSCDISHPR